MNFRIITLGLFCVLTLDFSSVDCQTSGTELLSCSFEMPTDCGFIVRTAAGGVQWSLNNGKSFEGKIYGPPKDHSLGTADGYYASTVVLDTIKLMLSYPIKTDMMTPSIDLPNGEGALVFYFYAWRSSRNDQEGTTLNVYGCQGRKLWGSTVHVAMEGWQRLEIPLQCAEPFEIYFEGIHHTIGSSISIDDVTVYSTPLDSGNHSPFPSDPGTDTTDAASIPEGMATRPSGDPTKPMTDVLTPTELPIGKNTNNGPGASSVLAVILFLMAFLLLGMSVAIHLYFWKKRCFRKDRKERSEPAHGVQTRKTAYDCLTLQPGGLTSIRGTPEGHSLRSSTRSGKEEARDTMIDIEANHGAATMDNRKQNSFTSGFLHRSRSKTLPSKGSQSSFRYYEIVEFDDSTGRNYVRRAPKLSVIGKSRAISRSNSVPLRKQSSTGTYERVDGNFIGPGGLYHITNLVNSPLRDEVFSFDSSASSLDSKSYSGTRDNTPFATMNRQRKEIPSTAFATPSDIYSTISSKISKKFGRKDAKDAYERPLFHNAYDTPQARRKAFRKQSQELRKQSTGHTVSSCHSSIASPNYYTLEPNLLIPDIITTPGKMGSFSESSRDSVRLECLDSATGSSYNTLCDDYTDEEKRC